MRLPSFSTITNSLKSSTFRSLLPKSKQRCVALLAGVIGVALALPTPAHAGIFGVFDSIFGTIQNDMGT